MVVRIFMSHTKLDRKFCDRFDTAAARVGVKVFRSEFETIEFPAWKTIRDEMDKSSALFLLVGKELVKAQALSEANKESMADWKFTQNWISYEIGLACQRGIDVWVMCDAVRINFPVPYLNNYSLWGIRPEDSKSLSFVKGIFNRYSEGKSFSIGVIPNRKCTCPYCGAIFNLHSEIERGGEALCPTCLGEMVFHKGWISNPK